MNRAFRTWAASMVRRWHSNYDLCDTRDCTGGHSARVALLALQFEPSLSRKAIMHALTHDLGEHVTGDWAYDFKIANPELAERGAEMERAAIRELGFGIDALSEREAKILKMADWLDAWLWMMRHRRALNVRQDWRDQLNRAGVIAEELGLLRDFEEIVSEAFSS